MSEQYSDKSTFICFEQQCHLNRIITSWDQLKLHNEFNHRVISKQRFESKAIQKFNQFNQQYRIQVQEDINEMIQYQQDKIIVKIQESFDFFLKMQLERVQNQIYFDYQLSNPQSPEVDIQKYTKIYYEQIQTPQQEQEDIFLNEIWSKFNQMVDDFLNLLEKYFTIENQYFINAQTKKETEFDDSTLPQSKTIQPIEIQKNIYQTEFISNKAEQIKYEINQIQQETNQIKHYENISQQYSTLYQNQQNEQDDLNNIPLKGYKQYQIQQQNQSFHTEDITKNEDDRLKFQLPSELINNYNNSNQISNKDNKEYKNVPKTETQQHIKTSKNSNIQYVYVPKTETEDYIEVDNIKQYQKDRTEVSKNHHPRIFFFGKKFDLKILISTSNIQKTIKHFLVTSKVSAWLMEYQTQIQMLKLD
ncbi:unnamed protein product [Paramecium sonneborni]|uniref:Uncharacterized protein n=1 Tax=Paramecium sonneborni TaxID=65129 RepID=A0A8S1KQS2_9CILI|nr:unnamed protein product [Paramecium sonneborni]